jgi:hypothetical protein
MTLRLVIAALITIFMELPALGTNVLKIPAAPNIAEVSITVAPGWIVQFRCSHDELELTCRIDNLKNGDALRFPELMVDPQDEKTGQWRKGQWWLHSSYNLCEGNGEFNVYNRDGVFQCAKEKPGWSANPFPLKDGEPMEIRVSLAKLGLVPGRRFGLALDVTDTQSHWSFWPTDAKLASPATWAEAELIPTPKTRTSASHPRSFRTARLSRIRF